MLILKGSDRALYVMRGEGDRVRVTSINGAPPHLGQLRSSRTAFVLGENPVVKNSGPGPLDIVEILEPEGEAGALTRAVLELEEAEGSLIIAKIRAYAGITGPDVVKNLQDRKHELKEKVFDLSRAIAGVDEVEEEPA